LSSSHDAKGRNIKINKMQQPNPQYRTKKENLGVKKIKGVKPRKEGDRLPASYVNFYIANNGVIIPSFNDYYDKIALKNISKLLPHHKIIQVDAREIILAGGGIHCITKQIP